MSCLLYGALVGSGFWTRGGSHLPVIAHGLGEREDVSPSARAECGVHQHINVYRRWLLEVVDEPRGRIHGSLLLVTDGVLRLMMGREKDGLVVGAGLFGGLRLFPQ